MRAGVKVVLEIASKSKGSLGAKLSLNPLMTPM